MSLAQSQHFNLEAPAAIAMNPAASIVPVRNQTNYRGQIRPVSIVLEEVMFTGRVPVSTWSFAFATNSKLWISDLTTLYFGERLQLNKAVYSDKLYVADRRLDLDLSMTAYNSYGDVLESEQKVHGYIQNVDPGYSQLVTLEDNWMHLVFKLKVLIK